MATPLIVSNSQGLKPPLLLDQTSLTSALLSGQADNPYTPGHWSQNLIIRLIIGLLVTVAGTVLLVRLAEIVLFWITPVENFWKSTAGFATWQALEIVAVFFGGMLCVAGRSQLLILGVLLGMLVGFLSLGVLPTNINIPPSLYFVMPAWFTVSSCAGAWLGEFLWHPPYRKTKRVFSTSRLTDDDQDMTITQLLRQAILGMIFANIRWLKIFLAVIIILPTLAYTHDFMTWFFLKSGLLAWVREVGLQSSWLELMIKVFVVVLCGAMAGAGTNHGIAHGFWTGVICGVLDLLWRVFIPSETVLPVDEILWEIGWVFVVSIVAGAFGALVVPPIMYLAKRRRPVTLH